MTTNPQNTTLRTVMVTLGCAFLAGCGSAGSEALPLVDIGAPSEIRQSFNAEQDVPDSGRPQDRMVSLPFPQRKNPFLFPTDVATPQTPAAGVGEVRVLGFIEVDRPRVLLRFQNLSRTLAVGDKTQGVEVVSIEPPVVKLRQGNLTWNASLFD